MADNKNTTNKSMLDILGASDTKAFRTWKKYIEILMNTHKQDAAIKQTFPEIKSPETLYFLIVAMDALAEKMLLHKEEEKGKHDDKNVHWN